MTTTGFELTTAYFLNLRTVAVILKSGLADQIAAEHVLFQQGGFQILPSLESLTCEQHKQKGQKFANRAIINIYFNNKRNLNTDSAIKDRIKIFKKRQRKIILNKVKIIKECYFRNLKMFFGIKPQSKFLKD